MIIVGTVGIDVVSLEAATEFSSFSLLSMTAAGEFSSLFKCTSFLEESSCITRSLCRIEILFGPWVFAVANFFSSFFTDSSSSTLSPVSQCLLVHGPRC